MIKIKRNLVKILIVVLCITPFNFRNVQAEEGRRVDYSVTSNTSPMLYIDNPTYNSTISNKSSFVVRGWALNKSGIKEVKIYLNNIYIGNATVGMSRTDVRNAYPEYIDSDKSGYEYNINTTSMSAGTQNIKVQAIGNDGTIQESTSIVNLDKPAAYTWIDEPTLNAKIKGNIKVRGWAVNASGIKEVKVYANNIYIANATIGMSRPDVRNAYPEYINSDKSGYEYDINTTSIPAGTQNIKVQAIGNDGTIQESTSIVNLEKLAAYTWLDEPIINSPINGNIKVRGWAVNASGVKEVKIYVNKTYIGSANIGISRSDVGKVYPEYINSSNSGYEYTVDVSNIAPGIKELSIQSIGNDGSSQTYTSNVNIIKPTPKTYIDEPTINSSVNNDLKIRGWAVNASTIKEIKLYLDNNYVGSTGVGLPRLDVGKAYPEYRNAGISGYEYTIDTSSLNQGIKTIKVQAIGYDGTLDETTVKINIVHSTTTYIPYPKSFNSYVDIQMEKKPLIQDRTAWREATKDEISYYMNPLNFVNDSYGKYMFLKLTYSEGIQAYQLNNVLKGKGVLDGKGQAFIEAGRRANVNPIYLVAHALLETGNGTSALAGGEITVDKIHEEFGNVKSQSKTVEPRVIFNMYGVGALDKDANLWGSEKAYSEGWFTVEDAIIGGAKWIGDGYINSTTYNQNTLYKMRWDFSTSSMWHQYATDIEWAYKQTVRIKSIIDSMDNPVIHFEIPIFN